MHISAAAFIAQKLEFGTPPLRTIVRACLLAACCLLVPSNLKPVRSTGEKDPMEGDLKRPITSVSWPHVSFGTSFAFWALTSPSGHNIEVLLLLLLAWLAQHTTHAHASAYAYFNALRHMLLLAFACLLSLSCMRLLALALACDLM